MNNLLIFSLIIILGFNSFIGSPLNAEESVGAFSEGVAEESKKSRREKRVERRKDRLKKFKERRQDRREDRKAKRKET